MIFAVISCLACAALVAYSAHATRQIPSTAVLERTSRSLRREDGSVAVIRNNGQLSDLVETIETAHSRAVGVAALNEFIADAEQESSRGAGIPLSLGRVCLTLGLLLAVLAVAQTLASAESRSTIGQFLPALIAVAAGLVGGLSCYQLGQQANRRRREYREQVRRLARLLEQRLPQEATTKWDTPRAHT